MHSSDTVKWAKKFEKKRRSDFRKEIEPSKLTGMIDKEKELDLLPLPPLTFF